MKVRKNWTREETLFLINNYETMTHEEMGFALNRLKGSIGHKCRSLGLHKAIRYTINETFFDTWSSEMSYFLGFVMADGYVSYNKDTSKYYLTIGISSKDEILIHTLNKLLCPEIKIYRSFEEYKSGIKEYCDVKYSSKYMAARLVELGVIPCKTGKEKLPDELPEEYFWDFVRGYFDGDGSFYIDKDRPRYAQFSIICSNRFILDQMQEITNIGRVIEKNDEWHPNPRWYWYVSRNEELVEIYNNIYNNNFSLPRKYNKFTKWINTIKQPTLIRGLVYSH